MKQGPDFIIIGAMKCATSTLHVQLAEQSGVFMTEPKEPNFFSDDEIWNLGMDWYESLFVDASEGDLRGESSTHYSKLPTYPDTVRRIADHVGGATKFVYVMRHPIDRLISHYMHEWISRAFVEPLDEAIENHPELVDYGLYAKQLEPFLKEFGPQRILPVFFDRLSAYPQQELERICSFIGYTGSPSWKEENKEQNVSNKRLRPTFMLNLLMNIPGSKAVRRAVIPYSIRERIKGLWRMNERPSLSEERLFELTTIFDKDLARLGGWLGAEISCQKFKFVGDEIAPSWVINRV